MPINPEKTSQTALDAVDENSTPQESWTHFPEAKVRLSRVKHLQALVDGLAKDGTISCERPRIELHDDGVFIRASTNTGKYPDILPVSVDIFIPVPKSMMPKEELINEDQVQNQEVKEASPEVIEIKEAS